ncbi:uncharacterized protein [Argopecten irradians]
MGRQIQCASFHPNSNYIATGSSDRVVRMWDNLTGNCVRILTGHKPGFHNYTFWTNKFYSIVSNMKTSQMGVNSFCEIITDVCLFINDLSINWELYKCCVSHLMADSLHLQDTTQPYSPGIPGSPEGGVAFTTFSNPMYFKEDKGEKSSPPPSPVTTKSGGDGSHDNPTFDDVNFNGDST